MGEVYLAVDTRLDRRVALKILPEDLAGNKDRMRRFAQEAKAAAALNHPNIAHIYEIGESGGTHFIAMEYVDGATLRELIHGEQCELRKLLRYLQQVAEGLVKAHGAGIVHRDLKPDNVMVTRDGYAKILDFGLAKLTEGRGDGSTARRTEDDPTIPLSTPGLIIGTVGYMSPEQAQGRPLDHRSDIFSFGCLLYEAATGKRAFDSDSTIDTLHLIVHASVPAVKEVNPSAPGDLTRIVRRCTAKDPEERYQSIREAAIELRDVRRDLEAADELETSVPPSSVGSPTSHPARTSKTAAIATSTTSSAEYIVTGIKHHKIATLAVAFVLIAGIALAAYLYTRKSEGPIDSIAVLPFVNQSQDPETEYLTDGLTESIINNLSQLSELRVSPRSSVFRYKAKDIDPMKAAQDLGVRTVLTGRLLQRADSLIISAELLDVQNNKQIWGEQYNRKVSDALAVQQEISREISERLRTKLSGEEQKQLTKRDTSNPEAYEFYLRGRYYWNKRTSENIRRAMDQFQQAADGDPNYALAYAGLADCHAVLGDYAGVTTGETLPKAKAFAERALQLDPSLAEAHATLAFVQQQLWEWSEAEAAYKRAIALNPNYPTTHHWYYLYLLEVDRRQEALAEIKRAHELDPLSVIISFNVASAYITVGEIKAAEDEGNKLVELDPNFARGHSILGLAYLAQRQYPEATVELEKAMELSRRRDRQILRDLGYCYGVSGKRDEARAIIKEIEANYQKRKALAADVAAVYSGLGEKDQAFAWLEKDFQMRDGRLARIRYQLAFMPLSSDPRYADLLRRMGLQP